MMLIIDNYPENERVVPIKLAVQEYTNEPVKILHFKQVKEIGLGDVSCVILSGSTCNLSNEEDEGNTLMKWNSSRHVSDQY